MSKIVLTPRAQLLSGFAVFVAVVVLLTLLYGQIGTSLGEHTKWALILFGPVLALFTHMSFLLFIPLCVPLVALLWVGLVHQKARVTALIGFSCTWLALGWWLHSLF
jgi:hypothetical protein